MHVYSYLAPCTCRCEKTTWKHICLHMCSYLMPYRCGPMTILPVVSRAEFYENIYARRVGQLIVGIFVVRDVCRGDGADGYTLFTTISAYTRQKAKSKYRNRIRRERASQKQYSDTHRTLYDRVKLCRGRKTNIKASECVNRSDSCSELLLEVSGPLILRVDELHQTQNFSASESQPFGEQFQALSLSSTHPVITRVLPDQQDSVEISVGRQVGGMMKGWGGGWSVLFVTIKAGVVVEGPAREGDRSSSVVREPYSGAAVAQWLEYPIVGSRAKQRRQWKWSELETKHHRNATVGETGEPRGNTTANIAMISRSENPVFTSPFPLWSPVMWRLFSLFVVFRQPMTAVEFCLPQHTLYAATHWSTASELFQATLTEDEDRDGVVVRLRLWVVSDWSVGFSPGYPVSPALSFRYRSVLASITLIGSQDDAVESRSNLSTSLILTMRILAHFIVNSLHQQTLPDPKQRNYSLSLSPSGKVYAFVEASFTFADVPMATPTSNSVHEVMFIAAYFVLPSSYVNTMYVAYGTDPLQQRLDVATTNVVAHILPTNYVSVHSRHHTWCPANLLCSDHNSCQQIFHCLYRSLVQHTLHTTSLEVLQWS
ncbi:hypothetical protein PR048_004340 [Dryococelus australis]|uniref:SWIM-type domain-containing protein n=1 Tax=Dryococelus australis TaxID=614101 RepID=A0ABQ9I5M5_9NEOP|nr:hypothetical protein PR048_004340 [Dryococelus australis]